MKTATPPSRYGQNKLPVLSIACAILCVLISIECVRSYHRVDLAALFVQRGYAQAVASHTGSVLVVLSSLPVLDRDWSLVWTSDDCDEFQLFRKSFEQMDHRIALAGFAAARDHADFGQHRFDYAVITLPHWFLVLLTLPFPVRSVLRWRRARWRLRNGLCLHCGYDLRASLGPCPECGMARV